MRRKFHGRISVRLNVGLTGIARSEQAMFNHNVPSLFTLPPPEYYKAVRKAVAPAFNSSNLRWGACALPGGPCFCKPVPTLSFDCAWLCKEGMGLATKFLHTCLNHLCALPHHNDDMKRHLGVQLVSKKSTAMAGRPSRMP